MKNTFSFLTAANAAENKSAVANAKFATSVGDILKARKVLGEYIFKTKVDGTNICGEKVPSNSSDNTIAMVINDAVAKLSSEAVAAKITTKSLENGDLVNQVRLSLRDGSKFFASLYGTEKTTISDRILSEEEIKKCQIGVCLCDGKIVYDVLENLGKAAAFPRFYLNISELMK